MVKDDIVIRNDNIIPTKPSPETVVQELIALSYNKGVYTLEKIPGGSRIYYVIKYFRREFQEGYKLQTGDILKFGAVEFLVREFCPGDQKSTCGNQEIIATQKCDENSYCRICRSEENTLNNPLVSLCKCSGSIKFVHAECMKAWYKSKTTIGRTTNTTSYVIKGLECELCKTKIPLAVEMSGTTINLVDIEKPSFGSYVVLESLNTYVKYVHVIYTEFQKPFTIRLVFLAVT